MSIIVAMTHDPDRLERYATQIEPLLPLAKRAYGSRDTISPQHDASREYTRLLVEFYNGGQGSLLDMAQRLGVQYAGVRRRVVNADVPPSSGRPRKKFSEEIYDEAVAEIRKAKEIGTYEYHLTLYKYWERELSMAKIAKKLGLSSANPLYYGVNRIKKGK